MECSSIAFSGHAIKRMFERGVRENAVVAALHKGEVLKEYMDDEPYPSRLVLWFDNGKPLHVVVARNPEDRSCYIITAHVPSKRLWDSAFRNRKQS